RHPSFPMWPTLPGRGPTGVVLLQAMVQTPHRFRSKRPFGSYVGLAVVPHASAEYRIIEGGICRARHAVATRGLNRTHNHLLKEVFKWASTAPIQRDPGFLPACCRLPDRGLSPDMP